VGYRQDLPCILFMLMVPASEQGMGFTFTFDFPGPLKTDPSSPPLSASLGVAEIVRAESSVEREVAER